MGNMMYKEAHAGVYLGGQGISCITENSAAGMFESLQSRKRKALDVLSVHLKLLIRLMHVPNAGSSCVLG